MAEKERDPKPLGDLMRTLVAGRGWGERMAIGRLRDAWPQIVGENVAAHSEPIRLARGVLTVRAEAGAWASELTMLAASIAASAQKFLGGGSVGSVEVQAGSPGSFSPSRE